MKPSSTPLDPESWHRNDANLRRAVQQWNGQLPTLSEGFAERMKERMQTARTVTDGSTITPKANVEANASSPQKRRLWPWWRVAAAVVAAIVTATVLTMTFQKQYPNEQQAYSHENQQTPTPNGQQIDNPIGQQIHDTNGLKGQQAHGPNDLKHGPNGLKGQQAHSPGHRPGNQSTEHIRPERAKASALTGRENSTNTNPGLTATLPFQGAATDKMAQTVKTQDKPATQSVKTQDGSATQSVNTHIATSSQDVHTPLPHNQQPYVPSARNHLALAVHFTPTLSSGPDNGVQDAPHSDNYYFLAGNGFTYRNYAGVKAESYTFSNNAVTINDSHHDMPLTVGISLNIPLNKRFSVETGSIYTVLRSTFNYDNAQEYRHMRQRVTYMGIPVQLQYSFVLTRALRLYALGGLQVDFPLSAEQNWQRINNGLISAEGTEHPSVPVQLSPIGGLGAQLNVTRHLSIFCQPSLQWFMPTSELDGGPGIQTYRTEHELAFSLPFGLRWTL